jgi:beta-glucosidase
MEGGHALADVLLGRAEPTGRLPFTVPTDEAHLPPFDRDADAVTYDGWHGYWRLARDGNAAAYPFGFGLGYTSLVLGDTSAEVGDDGSVLVTTQVRNQGDRPGTEVVQVYGGASGTPPRLVAFARVEVAAGAAVPVQVLVAPGAFARRPVGAGGWVAAGGAHDIVVARHAEDPDARRFTLDLRP